MVACYAIHKMIKWNSDRAQEPLVLLRKRWYCRIMPFCDGRFL